MRILLTIAAAGILLSSGCEEAFSPSAPYEPRLIVYSVLSSESDVQLVRVYRNYMPPDNDPTRNTEDTPVTDAVVTLSDGERTYTLRDTLLARPEKDRYSSDIFAYVASPLKVQRGKSYTLTVTSPTNGTATATTTVPAKIDVSTPYFYYLEDPWRYAGLDATASFRLAPTAGAFLVRLFIEYEAQTPDGIRLQRVEVPRFLYTIYCVLEIYQYVYPKVTRRTVSATARADRRELFSFSRFAYRRSVEMINERNLSVRFRRAVFYVVQFDEMWYRYYTTANPTKDRLSTRLDEPDFTNVNGGMGVFSSLAIDSLSIPLPEVMQASNPEAWSPCR